jgi:hypothetical protein
VAGERSLAGPDFDDAVGRVRRDQPDDLPGNVVITEKILPQGLSRAEADVWRRTQEPKIYPQQPRMSTNRFVDFQRENG